MTPVVVWMLVIIHGGAYNYGNITVIDNFATKDSCLFAQQHIGTMKIDGNIYSSKCIQVTKAVAK